jgi:DnaJ family protein C protein 3
LREYVLTDIFQAKNKKGLPYCEEASTLSPSSVTVLIYRAQKAIDTESFEEAIRILNEAKEAQQNSQRVNDLLNEAHTLLKRSKQKDYYKVLGVSRDADERTIKRAHRQMTKQYHPDKAHSHGIDKDEAEKRMAGINEAYEVLSNPELRQRFDSGDDPNNPDKGSPFQGNPFGHGGQQQFVFQQGGFPAGSFKFPFGGFQFQG